MQVNPKAPVGGGEKGTPPMLQLITGTAESAEATVAIATLDELARLGAQRMIEAAAGSWKWRSPWRGSATTGTRPAMRWLSATARRARGRC